MVRHPDKTFESIIYPPLDWTPSGDKDEDVQRIMQGLVNTLESAVRERPDQWYMFRPMWDHQPDGTPREAPTRAAAGRQTV